ncbi:MAG: transglycosylase SLT domain-containing protein [Gemmatimonadetes bacterium]|nr:transglycosylase SLT domain-containing protein [Gemmatimonadota bacterium]
MEQRLKFAWTIIRLAVGPTMRQRWLPYLLGLLLLMVAAFVATLSSGTAAAVPADGVAELSGSKLTELVQRAQRADRLWAEVEEYHKLTIAPIERVLLQYRQDPMLARRIAVALAREANRLDLEPRLLLAVLLVENPMLDPQARSPVGARGLMQVMPQHRGKWPPCPSSLDEVEPNICHGASIFANYFRAEGQDVERALLRYNGCVRGTNTPECHTYPDHVYARAGRASILAWLRPQATLGAAP